MTRIAITGVLAGLLFGVLDALIHANPWAAGLYEVYAPIARSGVNAPAGIIIDLVWGLVMAVVYIRLRPSLPGRSGLAKGLSYGGMLWLFRVAMGVASSWMMYRIPAGTLAYEAATGLAEMLLIGAVLGLALPGNDPAG